jgi:type I restriction enzyme S subunit
MELKPGYKLTNVGVIPEEWEITLLGQCVEVRSGIAKNAGVTVLDPIRVNYLRVANVQDGYLDLSEMKEIEIE